MSKDIKNPKRKRNNGSENQSVFNRGEEYLEKLNNTENGKKYINQEEIEAYTRQHFPNIKL